MSDDLMAKVQGEWERGERQQKCTDLTDRRNEGRLAWAREPRTSVKPC